MSLVRHALIASASFLLCPLAEAATLHARVEATSPLANTNFSFPFFTFTNGSSPGIAITSLSIGGTVPWDFIDSTQVAGSAASSRVLLVGEERPATDGNNGCTATIDYGFGAFGSGGNFTFAADPEGGGCGSAVVDIRSFLEAGLVSASVTFSSGDTLSGNAWVAELIDPQAGSDATNQRYVLELSGATAVPVPAAGLLLLPTVAGLGLVRRVRGPERA